MDASSRNLQDKGKPDERGDKSAACVRARSGRTSGSTGGETGDDGDDEDLGTDPEADRRMRGEIDLN